MKILLKSTKSKLKITLLVFLFVLSCLQIITAASESDRVHDLPEGKGSLQIEMTYVDDDKSEHTISGATFSVAKVADLTVYGGSANYTWISAFSSIGKEIAGMTAQESNDTALELENLISSGTKVNSYSCETDEAGSIEKLTDLDPGMYLVYNFNEPQTNDGTALISPYLIQVPQIVKDKDNNNTWSLEVSSYPKVVVIEENDVNLQIVKRVKDAKGKDVATKEKFWFSIYTDPEHTKLLEEIDTNPVEIDMKGFSIQIQDVLIHKSIDKSQPLTLYVVEVNEDGTPLDTKSFYGPVYDKHESVTLQDMTSKTVTVVNQEGWYKSNKDDDDDDNKNNGHSGSSSGSGGSSSGPKTGDSTPIALLIALLVAAFITTTGIIWKKYR